MSTSSNANQGNQPPQVPCYGSELLRRLRNEIPIDALIRRLDWPHKQRDGRFLFLCPICREFHTAVKRATNLGRCFPCQRNFNPIDFRMLVEREDFIQAVEFLVPLLPS
jgi:DNA primase